MRIPYKYVQFKHKPRVTFVSKALGFGYAIATVAGITFLMGDEPGFGMALLVVAVGLFAVSIGYNEHAKREAEKFYSENPVALFELYYDEEKKKLGLAYNQGQISREELDSKIAELDEIRTEIELNAAKNAEMNSADNNNNSPAERSIIPDDISFDDDSDGTFFLEDEDTMILEGDADDEETMALFAFEQPKPAFYLTRVDDNEEMDFIGTVFTIGSSTSKADYAVTTNKRVSRNHATVFLNDDDYYIKDNSKNGTFVNGEKLDNERAVMLRDGDTIELADEAFIVHIVQPGGDR